jgi:lipid-binding SYLF domain-containing protein
MVQMFRNSSLFLAASAASLALIACSTAPKSVEGRTDIRHDSNGAVVRAETNDPTMTKVLNDAHGSAVFPKVGKGAVGVGGAYGKGVLFQGGQIVGYCDVSQASVGLQLGAQTYTEIICFEDQKSFDRFKTGNFAFDAQATAVALKSGAGANAKYSNGVAVFTMDEAGLMFEAAIGGQKFAYQAL